MSGLGAPLRLRLYIAGRSPNSVIAANTLRTLLAEFSSLGVDLETVDVLREPERALRDGVLATPMLVKLEPAPERRILGNLSDRKTVLAVLGLDEARSE
jgi:circadian clock protein KaiB